jgi:ATP-dependent helicase/nuclease subunit B
MDVPRPFSLIEADSAALRLNAAAAFLREFPAHQPITIVAATRGAADDLARMLALSRQASFGVQRLSLTQLAARSAIVALAAEGVAPSTSLGAEAVATRAVFDAMRDTALDYFGPVARTPGFPRALARTLHELRLSGITDERVSSLPLAGKDLAGLLARFDDCFAGAGAADRARLFRSAATMLRTTPLANVLVLLDLPLRNAAERELVAAAVSGATRVLATVPYGDAETRQQFEAIGGVIEAEHSTEGVAVDAVAGDLAALRRHLFDADSNPPERTLDGSLELFSAPGEGRECVEIARRILKEARRGVPLDEMAILVRSPHSYFGLLEHALGRADVRAWFDRGTRRPHPAGRAFLTLLACASEQLSASRFAEYLSLGQVPDAANSAVAFAASHDEAFGRPPDSLEDELESEMRDADAENVDARQPIASGTLRAPWRWEQLLVESAVIGQDTSRWVRRLEGSRRELERQRAEAERVEGSDSARARGLGRTLEQLHHLRGFALPIIEELASWPARATWGEWLDYFVRLAPRVLRMPSYVLRVLADLRPMSAVGPIDLDEARRVLADRLLTLQSEPPMRRFGRVFVGTPDQVRGRSFRVVFVPGLAERMFPQKPREDPLLLDDLRGEIDQDLPTQRQRLAAERLLLQLAAGAASERLYVSYPRIELSESRARVPSFYALDVMRAATGRLPDHETLEENARDAGNATLAWPAPPRAEDAIDDQEHDLATLRRLLDEPNRAAVRGHAHYLLKLNDYLRRSVVGRWARGEPRWSVNDGLIRVSAQTRTALAAQRLAERPYSLSALQRFSACPYQFVLAAMYRLQPLDHPQPLQRMDPLTRGSIFHDIQARFFRVLRERHLLPVTAATITDVHPVLDAVIQEVIARAHDELAPAVERVWEGEVASIRRDLQAWIHYLARDGADWEPKYFEFAFGKVPGERDAASLAEDVRLDSGFKLRGAVDLIEEHRQTRLLRVTDHKTGRKPDRVEKTIIGGGAVLQPVLYAVAVQAALGTPVHHGRLFYCTAAGGFAEHAIPLTESTRAAGLEVLQVIDRAIERGFLAAAPAAEACDRCDFRPVCGPDVGRRVGRKPQEPLGDLREIRSRS